MCHFEMAAGDLGMEGKWGTAGPDLDLPPGVEFVATWHPVAGAGGGA
jgi:hypothetical protein